jgi:hypothetical protein
VSARSRSTDQIARDERVRHATIKTIVSATSDRDDPITPYELRANHSHSHQSRWLCRPLPYSRRPTHGGALTRGSAKAGNAARCISIINNPPDLAKRTRSNPQIRWGNMNLTRNTMRRDLVAAVHQSQRSESTLPPVTDGHDRGSPAAHERRTASSPRRSPTPPGRELHQNGDGVLAHDRSPSSLDGSHRLDVRCKPLMGTKVRTVPFNHTTERGAGRRGERVATISAHLALARNNPGEKTYRDSGPRAATRLASHAAASTGPPTRENHARPWRETDPWGPHVSWVKLG